MSELPAIERALLEAAQRRYPGRRRTAARAGARLLVVATLAVALAWVLRPLASPERADERPAPASTAAPEPARSHQPAEGFARQLSLLGVLRTPSTAADRQVRDQIRDWPELRPRAGYARVLGKPASGSAFVLVPVARYQPTMWAADAPRFKPKWAPDGLCLMPRAKPRAMGVCGSTQDLLDGSLSGERSGQVFGVVPDGVVAVRPAPGLKRVPVQRNFYVYPYTPTRHPPAWCDRAGTCREIAPWWWCDRAGTCNDTSADG